MQTVSQPKSLWSGEIGLIARPRDPWPALPLYRGQDDRARLRLPHGARRDLRGARHLRDLPALQQARRGAPAARDQRSAELQFRRREVHDDHGPVLGLRRHGGRRLHRLRARLPRSQHRALVQLRPPAAAAHLGGDLRLRRQRAARDVVLCRAAHVPGAAGRRPRSLVRGARLQLLHPDRRHGLSARHHREQGIRRARVVRRPLADHRLGHLSAGVPRHALPPQGAPHLRGELVLSRLHPDDRDAASRQQRRACRCRSSRRSPTSCGAACRTRCSSGGTATTRSASS